ncbi:MAG TPA: transcription elongation factor GreB [Burkholderiales bacterium]|nr:transcription elongation factor GreB [Burkholderiales bacterium]
MSKAFVRESESDDTAPLVAAEPSAPPRNYITPAGFARLDAERKQLVEVERPQVVRTVAWAAANGDRSENADYQYGKKRLREIDRRVRFLIKRLEGATVVNNAGRDEERVFFGATVHVRTRDGGERQVSIVGADEVDAARGRVSWLSPIARALLKARAGDTVTLRTPAGHEELEILDVSYPGID